jgi:hypothetical protein
MKDTVTRQMVYSSTVELMHLECCYLVPSLTSPFAHDLYITRL